MKILIAEDDRVSRTLISKFLQKYGECDLVVDGLEALDAFLMALRDKEPYDLICLDIMMPKADGISALKAIRDLEEQNGIEAKDRVKIIMTTALAEAQVVKTAFSYGCEAYATKPIDIEKLTEVMEKLGLSGESAQEVTEEEAVETEGSEEADFDKKEEFTTNQGMKNSSFLPTMDDKDEMSGDGYFKSVTACPGYRLDVTMGTGTAIQFDFSTRLDTARFGGLRDEELFRNVRTDGNYLIFEKAGRMPVKITASEFMDLVLTDRRR